MPEYATPGVYFESVDASRGAIAGIRTDIAGFVGIAERGPVDTPVPVTSWEQFQSKRPSRNKCAGCGELQT